MFTLNVFEFFFFFSFFHCFFLSLFFFNMGEIFVQSQRQSSVDRSLETHESRDNCLVQDSRGDKKRIYVSCGEE
jgi:hypothetical protein